jgi:hypothetical protein
MQYNAAAMRIPLLIAVSVFSATHANAQIVISQIYGGGGNSGASLRNDFVELFNRGTHGC